MPPATRPTMRMWLEPPPTWVDSRGGGVAMVCECGEGVGGERGGGGTSGSCVALALGRWWECEVLLVRMVGSGTGT
eukprot:11123681-Alexandrium_andersonii.AAC.1